MIYILFVQRVLEGSILFLAQRARPSDDLPIDLHFFRGLVAHDLHEVRLYELEALAQLRGFRAELLDLCFSGHPLARLALQFTITGHIVAQWGQAEV